MILHGSKMADEESETAVHFDEALLFREFEAEVTTKEIDTTDDKSPELSSLQLENKLLRAALNKALCYKSGGSTNSKSSPLMQVLFFNNKDSRRTKQQFEEFIRSSPCSSDSKEEPCSLENESFQSSASDLNDVLENIHQLERNHARAFVCAVRYFDIFCIDCTGSPLVDFNPSGTDGWVLPLYEQTFFTVLPCNEDDSKIKIRQRKKCFNCDKEGHNVQDCPEPQNQAKINANRREFIQKFSSPFSKEARYHVENERRYGHLKPGVISEKLREALGIADNELPPHVYRMRALGYPPAYLPNCGDQPSLLIYDGEGKIDDSVVGEAKEEMQDLHSYFVKYPGFNVPLPEGVVDRSRQLGMPDMQEQQQLYNVVSSYGRNRARQQGNYQGQRAPKRKNPALDRHEQDMDMDEDGGSCSLDINQPRSELNGERATKRTRYNDSSSDGGGGGYSPAHPGLECGQEEMQLLQRFRRTREGKTPQPGHHLAPASTVTRRRRSKEEGEIVSDEEESEGGDDEDGGEAAEEEGLVRTPGFWLQEPLSQLLEGEPRRRPPPPPPVLLPMEALTRFYTSSTVLQQHGLQDRFLLLDPIYGNVQVPSGRYERVKKILQNRTSRR